MDYTNMIQRMIDGLTIIRNYVTASIDVAAHSYAVMVPEVVYSDFEDDDVQALKDLGWSWNDDFGWVMPVIG